MSLQLQKQKSFKAKNIMAILAIPTLIIVSLEVDIKTPKALQPVFFIGYPVFFQTEKIRAFSNFYNKVNTINIAYKPKLGLI